MKVGLTPDVIRATRVVRGSNDSSPTHCVNEEDLKPRVFRGSEDSSPTSDCVKEDLRLLNDWFCDEEQTEHERKDNIPVEGTEDVSID